MECATSAEGRANPSDNPDLLYDHKRDWYFVKFDCLYLGTLMTFDEARALLGLATWPVSSTDLFVAKRKARQVHHPDKGGDVEIYLKIEKAVKVLESHTRESSVELVNLILYEAFKGCTRQLSSGEMVQIAPGVMHDQLITSNGRHFRIHIHPVDNVQIIWAKNPLMRDGQIDNSGLLQFTVHVPWLTLATGGQVIVNTPLGETHFVRVPAGICESGNQHIHAKIKGAGYWSDNYAVRRGDIHIMFVPLIPALHKMSQDELKNLSSVISEYITE